MGVFRGGRPLKLGRRDGKALLAIYVGDRLVWDGRISAFLAVPAAAATGGAVLPEFTVGTALDLPAAVGWSDSLAPGAATSATLTAPDAPATADATIPALSVSSLLELDTAADAATTATAGGVSAATDTVEMFASAATAHAAAPDPDLIVSQALTAPPAGAATDAVTADSVTTSIALAPLDAAAGATAPDPDLTTSTALTAPPAAAASSAPTPALTVDQTLTVPAAAAAAAAPDPTVADAGLPVSAHLAATQRLPNGSWARLNPWVVEDGLEPNASGIWTLPDAGAFIVSLRLARVQSGNTDRPRVILGLGAQGWMPADTAVGTLATGDGIGALMVAAAGETIQAQAWGTTSNINPRDLTINTRLRIDPYETPFGAPVLVETFQGLAAGANLATLSGWVDHMYSSGVISGGSGCLTWPNGAGTYRSFNCYYRPGPGSDDMWVRALIMMDPMPASAGYGGPMVVARHNGTSGVFGRVTADTWAIMRGSSNTSTTADSPLASGTLAVAPTVGDWLTLTVQGSTARLYVNDVEVGSYTGSLGAGSNAGLGYNRSVCGLLGRWEAGIMP